MEREPKQILFQYPEFGTGSVPTEIAAKAFGMAKETLLDKMEKKEIDIGIISCPPRKRGKRSYRNAYISPKKLWDATGFIWRGDQP